MFQTTTKVLAAGTLALAWAVGMATELRGEEPDVEALWEEIRSTRLDPEKAVEVTGLKLAAGIARFEIERGVFFFATPVGGHTAELVFQGEARLVLEPPDDVEAGQLELYTGRDSLAEDVSEAVLVLAVDAAVDAIAQRPPAVDLDPEVRGRAEELFGEWLKGAERRLFGVESALFRDALGDPFCRGYFAGWFQSEELGEFLFLFEPDALEQATLGQFVAFDPDEKDKRKLERQLHRAQRKGRLIGVEVEDLGRWETWLSASARNADGAPQPGVKPFEPQLYELDVSLASSGLELEGRARLHLRALSGLGRVVKLEIFSDLTVSRVALEGEEIAFDQKGGEVLAVLPRTVETNQVVVLEVEYSGLAVDKVDGKAYALRSTFQWYPHAGTFDLATYDVTFHWPAKLDLLASGQLVDAGPEGDGRQFARRRLELPTFGVSFAVGKYKSLTRKAGHVDVSLAVDTSAQSLLEKDSREELLTAVADSLTYFEEAFGPYPLDELVVVTAPQGFSQSFLGFVTLSSLNMLDTSLVTLLLGLEDRRTVVAHEIAHQWWGHMVPWQSYRDQWISEAMANYSAVLYARNQLQEPLAIGPTTGWQAELTRTTADGRAVESLGPLVLGERLLTSSAGDAYQPIVYKKGALVLEMLSRFYSEEQFLAVLRSLVKAVSFRPVSTESFVGILEKITGNRLQGFARQFIYGTGLPEVYYDYDFQKDEASGKWVVDGEARQQSPYRYRYRVVKTGAGGFDVVSERLDQIEVSDSRLVVPVQIAAYDPAVGRTEYHKERKLDPRLSGNVVLKTRMLLEGASAKFHYTVDHQPTELWLDRHEEVFGRFFNERRFPKRMLFYQGLDHAAAGEHAAAERFYREALAAESFVGPAMEGPVRESALKDQARRLDARVHLRMARLYLDQGRAGDAQAALEGGRKLLKSSSRSLLSGELKPLEARLAIHEGDFERAYKLLRKGILRRGDVGGAESLALFAIAARNTGHEEEYEAAVEAAAELGADVTALATESAEGS